MPALLTYGMLVSIDGFISGEPGGPELPVPGPELHRHFNGRQRTAALSIYGRRMWEVMTYWAEPDPDRDEVGEDFAQAWVETPKVVISTTMRDAPEGARLIGSDVFETVRQLKAETHGEIDVSGAELAASLGAAGLVDEYHLYVQPVVLGGGTPYFAKGFAPELVLLGSEQLPDGVVLTRYAPAQARE